MGTDREGHLLFAMALPVALSMLVQALYNIVDSAFVGQLSETALSAISMVFPFQTLFAALNVGIGVGMSQLISLSLGTQKEKDAQKAAGQGLFLSLCCSAFFLLFGLFFSGTFFRISGVEGEVARLGASYLRIITVFSLGLFSESVLERMLMSTGHTGCTMVCQITGAVLNILLDPILIFGLGPVPPLGIQGAAIATVLAQHVAALLAWVLHIRKNKVLHFSFSGLKPDGKTLLRICGVGASAALKQGAAAVVLMLVNSLLYRFTETATAVYGAFNRLYVFFMTPSWAIEDVLVILAAYNLGIGSRKRVLRFFRLSLFSVLGITVAGAILLAVVPAPFLRIFGAEEAMLSLGKTAFPILACFLPFQGASSTISAMLQGLGDGKSALSAGLIERFALPLLLVYLLSLTGNLTLVWWAFPFAEILGLAVSAGFMHRSLQKIKGAFIRS